MTPRRLLDETSDPTEQLLLRAVKSENLPREGRERIMASFGLAGAGLSAGASTKAAVATSHAPKAAGPANGAHASLLHAVTVKWVGLCALGLVPAAVMLARTRSDSTAERASSIDAPAPVIFTTPTAARPVMAKEEDGALAREARQSSPTLAQGSGLRLEPSTAVAPRPARRPHTNAPEVTTTSLTQEVDALRVVRSALDGGDAAGALAELDRFERRFAGGRLAPEAMALRIEGLAMRGDVNAARTQADHFDTAYPDSPYRTRLHSILAAATGR